MDPTEMSYLADLDEMDSKIFVQGPSSDDELVEHIAAVTLGSINGGQVDLPGVTFIVDPNSDADQLGAAAGRDGFLFYEYIVEVYFSPSYDRDRRVSVLGPFLRALWARGWEAVTANDYEDYLPRQGGSNAADDATGPR
jgi:hypothetical protein